MQFAFGTRRMRAADGGQSPKGAGGIMRTDRRTLRTRCGFRRAAELCASFCILINSAPFAVAAEPVAPLHRFELSGSATLRPDPPILRSERLRLKAVLTPAAIPAGAPLLQSDGRFALRATLGAASLVCYADTIFRDNFDGDGF